jgi:hydrogenase large subunit
VESGQLGPFKNGYWGSPAYKLPAEANLMAVAHYLEVLEFQKEIVKVHTIFGGKNPHPNWLVGDVPCPISVDGVGAVGAINMERLNYVSEIIDRTNEFIDKVYPPDLLAIASFYKDWLYGGGLSSKSVMSYGDVPEHANDYSDKSLKLPRGVIVNGKLDEIHPVDLRNAEEIQEFVTHSWYKYPDETKGLHPWDGVTEPHYELGPNAKGTKTNIEALD